jgi:hypothetical protein
MYLLIRFRIVSVHFTTNALLTAVLDGGTGKRHPRPRIHLNAHSTVFQRTITKLHLLNTINK